MANPDDSSLQVAMVLQSSLDNSNKFEESSTKDESTDLSVGSKKGGWPSALLLLMNQGLATIAFVGVEVNLVLFSTRVLKQSNAEAANTFSRWMGTVNLFSLMGAFLSDAYLGRYLTCALFQLMLATGLVALSTTTSFLLLKPHGCGKVGFLCESPSNFEVTMFYVSIYLVALGNGAYEPSLATFGSDQFDEEDAEERCGKKSFFSYFYVATNLGSLICESILAYFQNLGHWALGFWISTSSALVAVALLFSGSMRYRFFKPSGNPFSSFCQVIVAAWKKSAVALPPKEEDAKGGSPSEPRRPCTVTQVEEVKCVLRVLPIWLCTVTFAGVFVQMISLFVEQGAAMRTALHGFQIPPASLTAFDIVGVSLFIIFYDKLIAPLYTKLTNAVPAAPSDLEKMGAGLVVAIAGMIAAGLLERQRREHAVPDGAGHELSSLFILWQVPQYVLVGVGEAFVYVGLYDFFGSQVPEGLKSIGIGLSMASISIGSYLCSLVLAVVMVLTTKDGRPGWVPPNLNEGHLDKFFFLMAALTAMELVVYAWFAKRYKSTTSMDAGDQVQELI